MQRLEEFPNVLNREVVSGEDINDTSRFNIRMQTNVLGIKGHQTSKFIIGYSP